MAQSRARWGCAAGTGRNVALAFISLWAVTGRALDDPADKSDVAATSAQELAKEKHNPFADQITVPIQLSSSLDVGPGNGTAAGLDIQPAMPFSLGPDWKLILRPDFSILASEQPNRKLGLGDIELQSYVTPGFVGDWVWGIGPVLQFPTASEEVLGTGKWSAGPALGLLYMKGPWVNGLLVNHLWSFAGDRDRNDVSLSTFEPMVSYNFENGWFLAFDSTMTADWKAATGQRWTIPVGLDAGKAFQIGKQSLSLQFGTYYNIDRAEGAARWVVRLQLSLIFPKHSVSSHDSSNGA